MTAIGQFSGQECDFVYIFNTNLEDPNAAWKRVSFDNLPEVTASELGEYVVRSSMGNDFLYFACSLEEAAIPSYTTLLPVRPIEDEEDDLD